MDNQYSFMQGRLATKGGFSPQQFPWGKWKQEFSLAVESGFQSIEWMFNYENWADNPIFTEDGLKQIIDLIDMTGVSVCGICANYFMQSGILKNKKQSAAVLHSLLKSADILNAKYVVVPFFGSNEVKTEADLMKSLALINEVSLPGVMLLLETDFDIYTVLGCIEDSQYRDRVGICYDIGNAAGLNKDILKEISDCLNKIYLFHIKDKKAGQTSCMLGKGCVEWDKIGNLLAIRGYDRFYTFESYYDQDSLADTKTNYKFIREIWKK